MALVPNDQGPPYYRDVDEPECGDLMQPPVPDHEPIECRLAVDHDGNHVHVWDTWDGYAVGWER